VALFVGFSAFLLSQAVIMLFGFGIACAARRHLRITAGLVVAGVVVGFAAIWGAGAIASASFIAGRWMLAAGLVLMFISFSAWGLVGAANRLNNPIGMRDWAKLLSSYLAMCWVWVIFLGVPVAFIVQLATSPPGSLR
jgi:hypothetical protein